MRVEIEKSLDVRKKISGVEILKEYIMSLHSWNV